MFMDTQQENSMKFTVYLSNIGNSVSEHDKLEEAIDFGKKTGFEFMVFLESQVVGYFTLFGGWHAV